MTIGLVLSGTAMRAHLVIIIISCIILVVTNMLGIRQTQASYRFAPANKAQPIQQVPTQTVLILIFIFVFQRSITYTAIIFVPLVVTVINIGGFLLGNRRAELQSNEHTLIHPSYCSQKKTRA